MIMVAFVIILLVLLVFSVVAVVLAASGNVKALKFFASLGIPVSCGDIEKDYSLLKTTNPDGVAWLEVPDVCYAPVMKNANGYYRNHDVFKKENAHGELYLSNSRTSKAIKEFSIMKDRTIKDLCVITGSPYSAGGSLRHSNFSNLRSYVDSVKLGNASDIRIVDNKGIRVFRLAIAIDITKGARRTVFSMNSRESLIQGLSDNAVWSTKIPNIEDNLLLLRYYTDIDNLTLVFYEVKQEGEVNEK